MKVRELLSDESKWIRGILARNYAHVECTPKDPNATQWCLAGAVARCYPTEEHEPLIERIEIAVGWITFWNDNPNRTFAEVKALVDRLDI